MVDQTQAWPYQPNWSNPYQKTIGFLTDIVDAARSGREQRRAVRPNPRYTFEYTMSADSPTKMRRRNTMQDGRVDRKVRFADAVERAVLQTDVVATDTVFLVAPVRDWMVADAFMMIVYGDTFELVEIQGIAGSTITLKAGLENAFMKGARLYRAPEGFLPRDSGSTMLTSRQNVNQIQILERPFGAFHRTVPAAPQTYDSRELFTTKPNWAGGGQVRHLSGAEIHDVNFGDVESFNPWPYGRRRTNFTYLGRDLASTKLLEDVFLRARGRLRELYVPTWTEDMIPTFGLSMGSTNLSVEGPDLVEFLDGNEVFRHVVVRARDGSFYPNRISSVAANGSNTDVTMLNTWPSTVALTDIIAIHWLMLARFDTDDLVVEYVTDEKAQLVMPFRALEALADEGL